MGIVNTYKKSAESINKEYGTKFTWEDMANFYERKSNIDWDKKIGYKTSLYTIGVLQQNKAKIKEALEDAKQNKRDIHIVHDKKNIKDDKHTYLMLNYNSKYVADEDIMKALDEDGVKLSDIGF